MSPDEALKELLGIHLPLEPSCWPPALWFSVLIVTLSGISLLLLWWLYKLAKRRFVSRAALKKIARYRKQALDSKDIAIIANILKRVALHYYNRQEVASLYGEKWLQFLDKTGRTNQFTNGPGRTLITAPYQKQATYQQGPLLQVVESWLKQQGKHA